MKKIKYGYLMLMLALITSCTKEEEVAPKFDVKAQTTTIKAGEEVTFSFSGDAKVISFYSGEFKNDYAFKDGRVLTMDAAKLLFTSRVQFGTQPNQLRVLTSTNFNGELNLTALKSATWNDITNRFTYATTTTNVSSTEQDITDQIVDGKPLYLAFKYVSLPQTANGTNRTWTVSALTLNTQTAQGSALAVDQRTAAWTLVQSANITDPSRSTVSSAGTLTLRGNNLPNPETEAEIWAVSKSLSLGSVDLGPDFAVPIKNVLDNPLDQYKYRFATPGTYKVVFVASNVSIYGNEPITREITITVNP